MEQKRNERKEKARMEQDRDGGEILTKKGRLGEKMGGED